MATPLTVAAVVIPPRVAPVGLLILLLAGINFVNLVTARATRRALEVGVRKALGALRMQLLAQFMAESVCYALAGMMLGMALAELGLPTLNGWQSLGGVLSAGPAVAPVGGTLTFFVTGSGGGLYSRTLTTNYVGLSAACKGHPAVATQGSVSYLACHGSDDALWYSVNSGSGTKLT